MKKPINSILIANRGEIASRIIRTCKKIGIKSIAVFSEADRNSLFVQEADVAVFIGKSTPAESYLDVQKILATAKSTGADAIHPGYGFLSENVGFAQSCADEGIIFIGPNINAIDAMGSKSKAKTLMQEHNVPVVPGYQGKDQSIEKLTGEAMKIGFPVLLKATAGGGGKGMRIVHEPVGIEKAIEAAKRESLSAFGDDELIIEKYISTGRHIEFQIFGDKHGNTIHLLERECTIQRRYQKVIEESPSPIMNEALRTKMGEAAVNAAKALNYDNAGTVEFIYDDKTGEFYFLEVNTRLQVEHPVTEEITGLDLVQMQIESAQGLPLAVRQEDIKGIGYAIEVRLYAEDPYNDFLPATGTIHRFEFPDVDGLRIETAVRNGSEISIFYDPMIAKIIVHADTRLAAHRKMQYVLRNMACQGISTNQDFLLNILENEDFQKGIYDTHFISNKINLNTLIFKSENVNKASVGATLYSWYKRQQSRKVLPSIPSGWRNNFNDPQFEDYLIGERDVQVKYHYRHKQGNFDFYIGDKQYSVRLISADEKGLRAEIDGVQHHFNIVDKGNHYFVHNEAIGNIAITHKERFPLQDTKKNASGLIAPMPSSVVKVSVEEGQNIKAGDELIILSSMKMETTIEAIEDGIIEEVFATVGANIETGFLLFKIKSN